MKTVRNLFAVMLMGLAFAAFQADAQSRGRSASSTQSRTSSTQSRSSATVQSRTPSSQSRSSATVQSRTSSTQSRSSATVQSRTSSSQSRSSATVGRRTTSQNQNRTAVTRQESRPQTGTVNDRKPSNTVRQPAERKPAAAVQRPAERPGVASLRPSQRPSAGKSYKPSKDRPPVQIRPDHRHDRPRVHPIHRDFIAYDRPAHFWKPNHHFFGHRVRILPARAVIHTHYGITYYCYDNIWYRPYGSYYVVCRPPFGTLLAAEIISDMAWAAVRFSYYNTVYNTYRQINENSKYIAQQNEIIARNNATIASQNSTIAMNQKLATEAYGEADRLGLVQSYAAAGSEYFYQDGVFYTKSANGEYNVIIPPAGAMVETLPEDYEMVTLDGDEYYKVDDTVYKVTLSEGKPYFEVLGQLYS